ncbi:MAG: 16S rRNA (uracil(1498)-N(3))-methyltransferase, partial [Rikenellaceae bacterium]
MQLFYAPNITPPYHTLSEEESKHCVRVLRLGLGDTIHITDGGGNLFCCSIIEASPKRCSVEVVSTQREYEKMPYSLTVAIAPTKSNDRYHWFLEKATEVGISDIIPIITHHSERRQVKLERDEKIITSAVKQSLKAYHPQLHETMSFKELVSRGGDGRVRFIAHCGESLSKEGFIYLPHAIQAGDSVEVLIGPEGDFSPQEVELAIENGYREITLGSQRLRTETA